MLAFNATHLQLKKWNLLNPFGTEVRSSASHSPDIVERVESAMARKRFEALRQGTLNVIFTVEG